GEGSADRVDDRLVARLRREAQDNEPEDHELVGARPIVIERLTTVVEAPAVVLDRDLGRRVAEVDADGPSAEAYAVLPSRRRQPGAHEQLGDALLGIAVARVVAGRPAFQDLTDHRAAPPSAAVEILGDPR